MKTYVISIPEDDNLAALCLLPFQWRSVQGDRYIRTVDRHGGIIDSMHVRNYDAAVIHEVDNGTVGLGMTRRNTPVYGHLLTFNRHAKDYQAVLFNQAGAAYPTYRPLRCWGNSTQATSASQYMVMKNDHGARSIGQVIFDPREITAATVKALLNNSEGLDDFHRTMREHTDQYLFCTGFEQHPGEGYGHVKNAKVSHYEYVPDVLTEWRLITDHQGRPFYFLLRDRKSMGKIGEQEFYCASGAGQGISKRVNKEQFRSKVGQETFDYVWDMLTRLEAPLQSFDLYITSSGQWGFFETSPEFGTRSVPVHELVDYAKAFVENEISLLVQQGAIP